MRQIGPSLTANSVAMMRAAHQLFDDPIIFKDPIALSIIGPQAVSNIYSKKRAFKTGSANNVTRQVYEYRIR